MMRKNDLGQGNRSTGMPRVGKLDNVYIKRFGVLARIVLCSRDYSTYLERGLRKGHNCTLTFSTMNEK
jgi:hypothetical protein